MDNPMSVTVRGGHQRAPAEPRRILLIDADHRNAASIATRIMDAWPEAQIMRATTLQGALALLQEPIDCLLLGLDHDPRDGLEAIRQLRAAAHELPIVVIVQDEETGAEALGVGAQEFLLRHHDDGLGLARVMRHSVQRGRAERLWRELTLLRFQNAETARIQRGLIPQVLIQDARISTRNEYRPGNRRQVLGGDFFDVVQISPTRLAFVLGDVCGHGPDAASLGVQLRIAWRTLVLAGVSQKQRLLTLDRLTEQERHAEHVYATVASVEVNLATGDGRIALAGHPPPILESGGRIQLAPDVPGGPPLGLRMPPRWGLHPVHFGTDWTLLLYSDGLYEGHVTAHGTRLGIDGLFEIVAGGGQGAVWRTIPNALLDHVEALNDGPLDDDVAMLAVRFQA